MAETEPAPECQFCLWKREEEKTLFVVIHPATHLVGADNTQVCRWHSMDCLLNGKIVRKLDGSDPISIAGAR